MRNGVRQFSEMPGDEGCAPPGASLFFARAKKSKQKKARPCIRVWSRCAQTPLTPVSLRGHVTKGRPCPFVPRSASMPRVPLRNACVRPPEGELGAVRNPAVRQTSFAATRRAAPLLGSRRRDEGPLRRPNGIAAQGGERHGRRESFEGTGTSLRSVPLEQRWSEGTPAQPGPDVGCAFSLVTFSLHRQRESDSPEGAKPVVGDTADAQTGTRSLQP